MTLGLASDSEAKWLICFMAHIGPIAECLSIRRIFHDRGALPNTAVKQ